MVLVQENIWRKSTWNIQETASESAPHFVRVLLYCLHAFAPGTPESGQVQVTIKMYVMYNDVM